MRTTASINNTAVASLLLNVHRGYAKTVQRDFARRCWVFLHRDGTKAISLDDRHLIKMPCGTVFEFKPLGLKAVTIRQLAA